MICVRICVALLCVSIVAGVYAGNGSSRRRRKSSSKGNRTDNPYQELVDQVPEKKLTQEQEFLATRQSPEYQPYSSPTKPGQYMNVHPGAH